MVALDTSVFFATADAEAAALSGLINMGYSNPSFDDYQWVTTDTFRLLNHQVSPEDDALNCSSCHLNKDRMDLQGELGYVPSNPPSTCSTDCHKAEKAWEWSYGNLVEFKEHHEKHVREEDLDCKECHSFSRD